MSNPFPATIDLIRAAFDDGVPAFLGNDVPASSPSRSAPYVVDDSVLFDLFGSSSDRRRLLSTLLDARRDLAEHCVVQAILIGGSVARPSVQSPRDCDGVIFYELRPESNVERAIDAMQTTLDAYRPKGLDLRLIPADTHPLTLIKAACYFSLLFAAERDGPKPRHGTLLLANPL